MSYYVAWDNQNSIQASVPWGGRSNGFQQGRNAASQWLSGPGGQGRYYDIDSPALLQGKKPASWFRDKQTEVLYSEYKYGLTIARPSYNTTKIVITEGQIGGTASMQMTQKNWFKNNGGIWNGSGGTGGGGGGGGNNHNAGQNGFAGGVAFNGQGYSSNTWFYSSAGQYGGGGGGGGGGAGFRHINNSQGQTNQYGGGGGGGGAGWGTGGAYGPGQNNGQGGWVGGTPGGIHTGGAGGPNGVQGPTPGGAGGQVGQYGVGPPGQDGQSYVGPFTGGGAAGAQYYGSYGYFNQY